MSIGFQVSPGLVAPVLGLLSEIPASVVAGSLIFCTAALAFSLISHQRSSSVYDANREIRLGRIVFGLVSTYGFRVGGPLAFLPVYGFGVISVSVGKYWDDYIQSLVVPLRRQNHCHS